MQKNKRGGRFRITQWSFWDNRKCQRQNVAVYMISERGKKVYYEAVILHDPKDNRTKSDRNKRILKNADLVALEQAVENELIGMADIKWTIWIRIVVDGAYDSDWQGSHVGFKAEDIQFGVRRGGKKCWRNNELSSINEGCAKAKDYDGKKWTYILDTPENRQILEGFAKGFDNAVEKLAAFLKRDDMLERIAGMSDKLLPMEET